MIDSTPKPVPIQMVILREYGITLLKMQDHVVFACLSCGHAKVIYRQNWDVVVPPMGECKCEVKQA